MGYYFLFSIKLGWATTRKNKYHYNCYVATIGIDGNRVIYNQKHWVPMHLWGEHFSPTLYIPFWPLDIGTSLPALTGTCLREEEGHKVDEYWTSMSCWWPTQSFSPWAQYASLLLYVMRLARPAPLLWLDKEVQFWWGHAL